MLPVGIRALLWMGTVGLAMAAGFAHLAAGAPAGAAAAALTAGTACVALVVARATPTRLPYAGRLVLAAVSTEASLLVVATVATFDGRCLDVLSIPRLTVDDPSPAAAMVLGCCALVTASLAWSAGTADDGADDVVQAVDVALDDLARGSVTVDGVDGRPVTLPRGTTHGSLVRVYTDHDGWFAPDRALQISVTCPEGFSLAGLDVTTSVALSPRDALRGTAVALRTLDGTIRLNVPPLAGGGTRLRCKGLGLPRPGKGRGHLYVTVRLAAPPDWTPVRLAAGIRLVEVRTLTLAEFTDVLANVGWDMCQRSARWPQVYVVRYRGIERTELETMATLLRGLNRAARRLPDGSRRPGPLLVALTDFDGTLLFPFGADLAASITAALEAALP